MINLFFEALLAFIYYLLSGIVCLLYAGAALAVVFIPLSPIIIIIIIVGCLGEQDK